MHLKEEQSHGLKIYDKAISDAVSKYFRRALSIINYNCYQIEIIEREENNEKGKKIILNFENDDPFKNFFDQLSEIFFDDEKDNKAEFYVVYKSLLGFLGIEEGLEDSEEIRIEKFNAFLEKIKGFFLTVTQDLIENFDYGYLYTDLSQLFDAFLNKDRII